MLGQNKQGVYYIVLILVLMDNGLGDNKAAEYRETIEES